MTLYTLYKALTTQKARPKLSIQLQKAKSAKEVGELIADSWYGYGLEKQENNSGDTYQLSVKTKPKTFSDAMRYLWLKDKGKSGNTTTYRMAGMPYQVSVTVADPKSEKEEKHAIKVEKVS